MKKILLKASAIAIGLLMSAQMNAADYVFTMSGATSQSKTSGTVPRYYYEVEGVGCLMKNSTGSSTISTTSVTACGGSDLAITMGSSDFCFRTYNDISAFTIYGVPTGGNRTVSSFTTTTAVNATGYAAFTDYTTSGSFPTSGACSSMTFTLGTPIAANTFIYVKFSGNVNVSAVTLVPNVSGPSAKAEPASLKFDAIAANASAELTTKITGKALTGDLTIALQTGTAFSTITTGATATDGKADSTVTVTFNAGKDLAVANYKDTILVTGGGLTETLRIPVEGDIENADNTAPTVLSIAPLTSAKLPLSGNIVITFDEDIALGTGSITLGSATLTPSVAGAVLTLPYSGLTANAAYDLVIPADAVKDLSGNFYAGNTYSYTAVTPAPVIGTTSSPTFEAGAGLAATITVTVENALAISVLEKDALEAAGFTVTITDATKVEISGGTAATVGSYTYTVSATPLSTADSQEAVNKSGTIKVKEPVCTSGYAGEYPYVTDIPSDFTIPCWMTAPSLQFVNNYTSSDATALGSGADVLRFEKAEKFDIYLSDATNLGEITFNVSATGGRYYNLYINDELKSRTPSTGNAASNTKIVITYDATALTGAAKITLENARADGGGATIGYISLAKKAGEEPYTGPNAVLGTYSEGSGFTAGTLTDVNPNAGFSFAIQVPDGSPLLTDLDAVAGRTIAITSLRYEAPAGTVINFTNHETWLTPVGNHTYVLTNFDAVGANPLPAELTGLLHTGYLVAGDGFWWDNNTVAPAGNYLRVGTFAVPPTTGINDAQAAPAQIVGYYSVLGQKLSAAPEKGVYIIVYDNGTAQKAVK